MADESNVSSEEPIGASEGIAREEFDPLRRAVCSICSRPIKQKRRGTMRLRHAGLCQRIHDALSRLERVILEEGGIQQLDMTPNAQRELRFRLLILSTHVPRPRDKSGRFTRMKR